MHGDTALPRRKGPGDPGPRATVVVGALLVTDLTSLPVCGLTPRQFRTFLHDHDVPRCKIGRRTVVRVDRLLEVIDRLSGRRPSPDWSEEETIARAARSRSPANPVPNPWPRVAIDDVARRRAREALRRAGVALPPKSKRGT
jgi:hypothetical protein